GTCPTVVTRTFKAVDPCLNETTKTQTISVGDTVAPSIECPPDKSMYCGQCSLDPAVTGIATFTDACGTLTYGGKKAPTNGQLTYQDSATPDPANCPWTITRTWTAKDACGNQASGVQLISCVPFSWAIVTDSSLCSYDLDLSTACRDFRLLFTPYGSGYKLNASNPGQTYYNVFYIGTPGASVTFNLTLPYPYVTQGANPVHAFDGVTISGSNPTFCLTPGKPVPVTSVTPPLVTLANYVPQTHGSVTTVTVTMTVPPSGFIYLNMHLDYGLKGTVGLAKGGSSGNDAISQSSMAVVVPDHYNYVFSVSGAQNDTDGVCNINVFKKNPGVGGRAGWRYTLDGVSDIVATSGATVTLKDAKGTVLSTGLTDQDGWYMLNYKYTGKATTLYVTLKPVSKPAQTQSITLKANGFVEVNFDVP
ncbi:MAG TPA: hypothetical protein VNU68_00320, partial [Verrucomicrobiae bacterium]|nr:hypothetical protein [Verrucomicrobiae bacterium]